MALNDVFARHSDGSPDVWTVPADGSGTSRVLIPGAESPSALGSG